MDDEAEKITVTVVATEKNAALVEWSGEDGYPRRGIVPAGALDEGGRVETETLDQAIPYGAAWEEIFTAGVTPEKFAGELRRAGIWDVSDLYRPGGAEAALLAIRAAYGIDLAALLEKAALIERKEL